MELEFVSRLEAFIEPVESCAATIIDEMTALNYGITPMTLVHTDINPSNVLIGKEMPYIIDWGSARLGSFYLDLPHHFSTLEQADEYRVAMADRGYDIERSAFARGHVSAARYTALRYLRWTLGDWQEDPLDKRWVRHYLGMIVQ